MTVMADGMVVFAGGYDNSYLKSAQILDPSTNQWLTLPSLATARRWHTATRLPSGDVLFAGGRNDSSLTSAEIFSRGKACTVGAECPSGQCVDGYCCDSACGGACSRCDRPGLEGTCSVRAAGSLPRSSCGSFLCDGSNAGCPASCSDDSQCVGGTFCNGGSCVAAYGQGASCSRNRQCSTGNCSDGFCCNQACAGPCDVCSIALGATADGVCANLPATTACGAYFCTGTSGACPTSCTSDANCVGDAFCDASGQCKPKLDLGSECNGNNQCSSGFCADGRCCNSACSSSCERCDVNGAFGQCLVAAAGYLGSPSCAPYVCQGTGATCPTSCASDAHCAPGADCVGGICKPRKAPGTACSGASECASGHCVDGVCCDSACGGACDRCDVAGSLGTCSPVPAGVQASACGLYLCNGVDGTCPTSCTDHDDCKGHCQSGACQPKQPVGPSAPPTRPARAASASTASAATRPARVSAPAAMPPARREPAPPSRASRSADGPPAPAMARSAAEAATV